MYVCIELRIGFFLCKNICRDRTVYIRIFPKYINFTINFHVLEKEIPLMLTSVVGRNFKKQSKKLKRVGEKGAVITVNGIQGRGWPLID